MSETPKHQPFPRGVRINMTLAQYDLVASVARRMKTSVAEVVRSCIDVSAGAIGEAAGTDPANQEIRARAIRIVERMREERPQ